MTCNAKAELRWEHELFPRQIIPAAAFSPPIRAGLISPMNQAVDVSQSPVLIWTPGSNAAEHDIYWVRKQMPSLTLIERRRSSKPSRRSATSATSRGNLP